jgi:hypothetical protein
MTTGPLKVAGILQAFLAPLKISAAKKRQMGLESALTVRGQKELLDNQHFFQRKTS